MSGQPFLQDALVPKCLPFSDTSRSRQAALFAHFQKGALGLTPHDTSPRPGGRPIRPSRRTTAHSVFGLCEVCLPAPSTDVRVVPSSTEVAAQFP